MTYLFTSCNSYNYKVELYNKYWIYWNNLLKTLVIVINIVTTTYPNGLKLSMKKFVQKIIYYTASKKLNMWEILDKTVVSKT